MRKIVVRKAASLLVATSFLSVAAVQPAAAAVIGTDRAIAMEERALQARDIRALVSRADVQAQLEALGVAPGDAIERVAALTDAELVEIGRSVKELPAGGDALAVIGAVFLVLIILELVGVINIFKGA
jgi:hypothetical protein